MARNMSFRCGSGRTTGSCISGVEGHSFAGRGFLHVGVRSLEAMDR